MRNTKRLQAELQILCVIPISADDDGQRRLRPDLRRELNAAEQDTAVLGTQLFVPDQCRRQAALSPA